MNDPMELNQRGLSLAGNGKYLEAMECFSQAVALKPDFPFALNNLGCMLQRLGRFNDAIEMHKRALAVQPGNVNALNNLCGAYRSIGADGPAMEAARMAVALAPEDPRSHNNLAMSLQNLGRLDEAESHFTISLRLNFDPAILGNLSGVYFETGRLDECLAALQQAIEGGVVRPDFISSWLHTLLYHPQSTNRSLREAHEQWDRCFAPQTVQKPRVDPAPNRPLRIGFVSPDLHEHPIARNILPLLKNIGREIFRVYCYSDSMTSDNLTDRIKALADEWRNIAGAPDDAVEQKVRDDNIDILVDLALHTSGNRLTVFARRPAPVQISWAGYPGSTGLSAIDARLSDRFLDPPENPDGAMGREQVLLLPTRFWCYELDELPDPTRDPGGAFTFGSLSKFAKINPLMLGAWARILGLAPDSRLLILAPEGAARGRVAGFFKDHGIDPERIGFVSPQPRGEYLKHFKKIDVMLDVYPYNGHSSTLDALSMGVPVISLAGQTPVSRGGLSLLSAVGLESLVATDLEGYIRLAADFYKNPGVIGRDELRKRLQQSPLADGAAFARGFEKLLLHLWSRCQDAD